MANKRTYNEISGGETEQSLNRQPKSSKLNCAIDGSSSSSQKQVETLPKAGKKGNDAGHGNRFQSKLLILYALRAINFGYQFYLGTELLYVSDKFDDLIFYYKKENDVTNRKQYLQAKHRLNENDPKKQIIANDLLDVNNRDFSLLKYFQSYVTIRNQDNDIEHCIICTNVDFNHKDIMKKGITLKEVEEKNWPKLLDCKNTKKCQNCYRLEITSKLKSVFIRKMLDITEYTREKIECLLDEFLKTLMFAVKMPNEDELDFILLEETKIYFELSNVALQSAFITNQMVNWFKRPENHWLTSEVAKNLIIEKVDELMMLNHRTSLSNDYQVRVLKKNVLNFNDSLALKQSTRIVENFLKDPSKKNVMHIISETPKLTAVKFISAINKIPKFQYEDDYLVISSKRLRDDAESLKLQSYPQLLLVVDEDGTTSKHILECEGFVKNSFKKIILISYGSTTDAIAYKDLSEKTKEHIGNIQVSFQGTDCKLTINQFIDMKHDKLIDSKLIEYLLYKPDNQDVFIPPFSSSGFNQSLYIERTLKFYTKDQLESAQNKLVEDLSNENNEKIAIDENGKIDWKIEDDQRKTEIWEKFKNLLEENKSDPSSTDVKEEKFIYPSNNRIIITGVAGTGKSTILSKYYDVLKKEKLENLVIKISLMKYSKVFKNIKNVNQKTLTDFLINNVIGEDRFARLLLKHRLEMGDRIILMLDGFDEIDTKCQDKVVQLVKTLNKSIPLYITTRPHLADKLQFELSQLAYSLVTFTADNQINYITSIWKEYLKNESIAYEEETIQTFAKHLTDRVAESLKDKEKEFIGIPLQCRILAECFQSKIKEKLSNRNSGSSLLNGQNFDLASLYKSLIEEKYRVFGEEKIKPISDDIVKKYIEDFIDEKRRLLRNLALRTIVSERKRRPTWIPSEKQSEIDKKQKEKQLNEFGIRLGLLNKKSDQNEVEFLHKTYAEYLLAEYVFNEFLQDDEKRNQFFLEYETVRKWIMENMLVKDNYEGVRVFVNSMMKDILNKEEWENEIETPKLPSRLQKFADGLFKETNKQKWALTKAFEERNSNIILFILNCLDATKNQSKIPAILFKAINFKQQTIFDLDLDVFNQILNFLDGTEKKSKMEILEKLFNEWNYLDKRRLEHNVERFLDFVYNHKEQLKEISNRDDRLSSMALFIIHSNHKELKEKYFKIVTFIYSEDSYLTDFIAKEIEIYFGQEDFQIDQVKKTLTTLQKLERNNVAAELFRLVFVMKQDIFTNDDNTEFLKMMGMTTLHRAAVDGNLKTIEKEIGFPLESSQTDSDEKLNYVLQLMANAEKISPLELAAAYGHENICQKLLLFLGSRRETDVKELTHRILKDAIKYDNLLMFENILKSVEAVQDSVGGLEKIIESLRGTDVSWVFKVLRSDKFVDKFNQENQIPKLIDILITNQSIEGQAFRSYWSDFLKNRMSLDDFLVSKKVKENDLKKLLLSRDDKNIVILFQFYIEMGKDDYNKILSTCTTKKEIEDSLKKQAPQLTNHFFSSPDFLESLAKNEQLNAIEYYLNRNKNQLKKFSQVVKVDILDKALENTGDKRCKMITTLITKKLGKNNIYDGVVEKYLSKPRIKKEDGEKAKVGRRSRRNIK